MYKLREYQQDCVDSIRNYFKKTGEKNALVEACVSFGKTLVIADIVKNAINNNKKVLVMTHTVELIIQNYNKVVEYSNHDINATIFCASANRKQIDGDVVVASEKTLCNAINNDQLDDLTFDLIIVDEVHRMSSDHDTDYMTIYNHIKNNNKNVYLIGLTGTPYRDNNTIMYSKHSFFKELCYRSDSEHLLNLGYLSQYVKSDNDDSLVDLSKVKLNKKNEISNKVHHQLFSDYVETTVQKTIYKCRDNISVIIFCVNVKHANEVYHEIEKYEPNSCIIITGTTESKKRRQQINQFKELKYKYAINVGCLTTGFDAVNIEHGVFMRAITQLSLWIQCTGRLMRVGDFLDKRIELYELENKKNDKLLFIANRKSKVNQIYNQLQDKDFVNYDVIHKDDDLSKYQYYKIIENVEPNKTEFEITDFGKNIKNFGGIYSHEINVDNICEQYQPKEKHTKLNDNVIVDNQESTQLCNECLSVMLNTDIQCKSCGNINKDRLTIDDTSSGSYNVHNEAYIYNMTFDFTNKTKQGLKLVIVNFFTSAGNIRQYLALDNTNVARHIARSFVKKLGGKARSCSEMYAEYKSYKKPLKIIYKNNSKGYKDITKFIY